MTKVHIGAKRTAAGWVPCAMLRNARGQLAGCVMLSDKGYSCEAMAKTWGRLAARIVARSHSHVVVA